MLGVSTSEAANLKKNYFSAIPSIAKFLRRTINYAEDHKRIVNWMGRISRFPLSSMCYKAPNYLIQGSCADITKTALVNCATFLKDKKSRIILTVHDSIVFEIHQSEIDLVEQLKKIMISAYPSKHISLTVSVDYSTKNLAETDTWTGKLN
jgi:DNA polymerase-1